VCGCDINKLLTESHVHLIGVLLLSSVNKTLHVMLTVVRNISALVAMPFLYKTGKFMMLIVE